MPEPWLSARFGDGAVVDDDSDLLPAIVHFGNYPVHSQKGIEQTDWSGELPGCLTILLMALQIS